MAAAGAALHTIFVTASVISPSWDLTGVGSLAGSPGRPDATGLTDTKAGGVGREVHLQAGGGRVAFRGHAEVSWRTTWTAMVSSPSRAPIRAATAARGPTPRARPDLINAPTMPSLELMRFAGLTQW